MENPRGLPSFLKTGYDQFCSQGTGPGHNQWSLQELKSALNQGIG